VGESHRVAAAPLIVLTIGHGSHESRAFLGLLRQHGIATVADVRSTPYSRYAPHFSKHALCALLEAAGMRYVWAGDALGGRPRDPACYHQGVVRIGNVDYQAMARQTIYQQGVASLLVEAARGAIAVMCSEEDPRRCHRHRLIEPSLRELGITVLHIRADGSLETIDAIESAAPAEASPQLVLEGFVA
jgi:uncharacterized protein (DUF488 family)